MGLLSRLLGNAECPLCWDRAREARQLEKELHEMELKFIRANTMAELYKHELDRLVQVPASKGGGFQPMEVDEPEPQLASDAQDFAKRIDEIFGQGLDLSEYVRRNEAFKAKQLQELEDERNEIRRELQRIP